MAGTATDIGMRLHDLLKAVRLMKHHRSAAHPAVPTGLLGLLTEIDRLPVGCRSSDLATRAGLDPSTVSRAVAGLVTHGLIAREADPHDGRATLLVVTSAGRTALSDAFAWYGRLLSQALAGWSPEEIAAFQAGLDRYTCALTDALTTYDTTEAVP